MTNSHKKKINISIMIPFAILALLFGLLVWKKVQDSREVTPAPPQQQAEPIALRKVVLLFVSADGTKLVREGRELDSCAEQSQCLDSLMEELLNGSLGDLKSALPETTIVNSAVINNNRAMVDLNEAFAADLPSGSNAEMLAVYSLVNTIGINFPAVTQVQLTVAGKSDKVLRHLDLRAPLTPDFSLIQETVPAAPSEGTPALPPPTPRQKGTP